MDNTKAQHASPQGLSSSSSMTPHWCGREPLAFAPRDNKAETQQPPEKTAPPCQVSKNVELLRSDFLGITLSIKELAEEMSGMRKEMARLKTDERILEEMQSRCQESSRQHYERHVLNPMLLGMIGIADRCRQSTEALIQKRKTYLKQKR